MIKKIRMPGNLSNTRNPLGEEQVAATMFTFLFWVQLSLALVEDRNITEMRKGKQALGVFTVVRVIFYQVIIIFYSVV